MRALLLPQAILLLLPIVAAAAPGPLEQALEKAGLEGARVEQTGDHLRVSGRYGETALAEPALRRALLSALLAVREADGDATRVALELTLPDGQVLEVEGDPRLFQADMDEVRFLRAARVRFLTRGPTLTPGPCPPKTGCRRDPERCPCEPGSLCEPDDAAADKRGCISVRASQNTEVRGGVSLCAPGHTWDEKGLDCVPAPSCGPGGLENGGSCVCPPGIEQNAAGGCGPLPVVAPDAGPPRLDAGPPRADGGAGAGAGEANTGFPRWVWQAMAGGVLLSAPVALFLLGSILGGLRSRRRRIGLKKYCIHCGRKLAMEDTRCRKCKTEQP